MSLEDLDVSKDFPASNMVIVVSIYDRKASFYHTPMFFQNVAVALRQLRAQLKMDKESLLRVYPEDFVVVQIAQFFPDMFSLVQPPIYAHEPPIEICSIKDLISEV